jgi:hypothetical protein
MSKKTFALLLLVSTAALVAKTPDALLNEATGKVEAPQPVEHYDNPARPLDEILPDFFNELDRSLRATTVDLMSSIQEGLGHLHKELEGMSKELKEKGPQPKAHHLVEEADKLRLGFSLPKNLKYEPADIDLINDKILSLIIKDEKHTVTIGITLDRKILTGQIRIEKEEKTDKGPHRSYSENSFKYRIVGKAQFEKVAAEYNETTHTLSFIIPKEFEVKNKRTIKVTIKK